MTEQFEKWCQQFEPDNYEDPHFWLTAFVKEVERRANIPSPDSIALLAWHDAYMQIVRDFGLTEFQYGDFYKVIDVDKLLADKDAEIERLKALSDEGWADADHAGECLANYSDGIGMKRVVSILDETREKGKAMQECISTLEAENSRLKEVAHQDQDTIMDLNLILTQKEAEIERLKEDTKERNLLINGLLDDNRQRISELEIENGRLNAELDVRAEDEEHNGFLMDEKVQRISELEEENARLTELLRLEFRPE